MAAHHGLPAINALVGVWLPGRPDPLPSRVEDVVGGDVVLSAPSERGRPRPFAELGTPVRLAWAVPTGLVQCSGALVDVRRNPLPWWIVRPSAAPVVVQRRDAFRLPAALPMRLRVRDTAVAATMLDLSHAGLRCRVPAGTAVQPGDRARVAVALDQVWVLSTAEVRRVIDEPGQEPDDRLVGLTFVDLDERHTDLLHRHLFTEQLRRRASERQAN